jgi:hypothetical protein
MSYKVMSHSLADQAANLADVYSRVAIVPLAKADILRQARMGLTETEGLSATDTASLVDGFILYRYGWWDDVPVPVVEKTLKQAFKQAWAQRKVRPVQFGSRTTTSSPIYLEDLPAPGVTGETPRGDGLGILVTGRSSSIPLVHYHSITLSQTVAPGPLQVSFSVTPVFPDGKRPYKIGGEIRQSLAQEDVLGVRLLVKTDSKTTSSYLDTLTFSFEVDPGATNALPDDWTFGVDALSMQIVLPLLITATEIPYNSAGVQVEGAGEVQAQGDYLLVIDLPNPTP